MRKTSIRSRLGAFLGTALLASVVLVAMAQPASAATCTYRQHAFLDGRIGTVTGNSVNVRLGPYFSCGVTKVVPKGTHVVYNCWTIGDSYQGTSTWTYVTTGPNGRGWSGWINDSLLSGRGASGLARCP